MNAYHRSLLCILIGCLLLASCATPEQTAAAVAAVGGTATALIDALKPVLSPEQLAKLHATAGHIDGTVASVQTAVGALADAMASIKAATESNLASLAAGASKLAGDVAQLPSKVDLYGHDAGNISLAYGLSRAASIKKHGFAGTAKRSA